MTDPLVEHHGYLTDRVKIARYREAIDRVVRPGHVVMDLGCGSGLLGLMALQAGAKKVLFVEEGAIIEVARRTIDGAGFADRAEFHRRNSFELALPGRVDVILCDHVGYFGIDYGILTLLTDAKARFLKPGGIMCPSTIELWLAPVETEDGRSFVSRWQDDSVPAEFAWVADSAANNKHALTLEGDHQLAAPALLATLELGADAPPFLSWQAEFDCLRDGTFDGLLGWFDCRLHSDIRMTNAPGATERLDRPQAFLPLTESLHVVQGEAISATIMSRHTDHVLAWTANLPSQGMKLSQTTFNGLLLDNETLERCRSDRVARLNDRGRARQVILAYCDGERTVGEIEALVRREHPQLFPSATAAEKLVRQVLAWDTGE